MNFARVLSVAVLIGHIGFGIANAQSSLKTEIPAEFPPASFKGTQYVDSRGCVYIRAGIDGSVTWVPRMTRSRQHICNAQPTFAQAPAPQPQQSAAASKVTILPPPSDAPKAVAAAPAPAPKPQPASRPAPRTVATQPAAAPAPVQVATPAPRRVMVPSTPTPVAIVPSPAPVRQVAVPARKVKTVRVPVARTADASGCRWASPQSAQYMRGKGVRCGPQTVPPISASGAGAGTRVAAGSSAVTITPTTRIAPLHVARMQAAAADVGPVPEGYRPAWEDDRLNPRRAHQTLEGKRMMDLRWTRDVPRRLVDNSTGLDVTAFNPDLVYPDTSMDQQMAAGQRGYLSTKGQPAAAKPTISTRSTPRTARGTTSDKALRVAVGHRYVQVGTYPSDAAARGDAARLKRAGLTVRMGTLHSGGEKSRVLLAGPYATPQSLGNALHAARRAGFAGAVTRK